VLCSVPINYTKLWNHAKYNPYLLIKKQRRRRRRRS
jgi:hypothetical protein